MRDWCPYSESHRKDLAPENVALGAVLQAGAYGETWRATIKVTEEQARAEMLVRDRDGCITATVKAIKDNSGHANVLAAQEAVAQSYFRHPHAVRLLFVAGGFTAPLQLVLEDCGTTILDLLRQAALSAADVYDTCLQTHVRVHSEWSFFF